MSPIQAHLIGSPGPLAVQQGQTRRTVTNGDTIGLSHVQVMAAQIEAPGLFLFQCPSCRHWYAMLHAIVEQRACLNCLEWRKIKL